MKTILFQITQDDIPFLGMLKGIISGKANIALNSSNPTAIYEIVLRAKEKGASLVCTTNPTLLKLLVGTTKIDAWAGSIIERMGIEFLILDPLEHLVTVTYGKHWYERCFSKFLHPERWMELPAFKWNLFEPHDAEEYISIFNSCTVIATDIETGPYDPEPEDERYITCVGFTGILIDRISKSYRTITVVVPFTDEYNIAFIRKLLASPVPKIFQNGKYDNANLLRYNSITINWAFDTINLFHAWYSELPKDLGFMTAYMLRKWEYHKDQGKYAKTEMEYWEYNARDTFTTALDFLALILEMPQWALENYIQEFSSVFPCLLAELTGLKADNDKRKEVKLFLETKLEVQLAKLKISVNNGNFNPSSPKHMMNLFTALGCGDLPGTGKIPADKAKSRHPLNKKVIGDAEKYKKDRKQLTSYFKDSAVWNGRIFYAINPHGTDTSRAASKESQFWCGLQIQNIPRDNTNPEAKFKEVIISDDGFYLGESDYSQAETWDTAYLSGDQKLLEVINDKSKDFHSYNANAFFGIPYSEICDSSYNEAEECWDHERKRKDIIDIAKRNNHGANYNMGDNVLLDTMGVENVAKAKVLLKLPKYYSLLDVTRYILSTFDKTYPTIRDKKGGWYAKVINDVTTTHFLVAPDGWRRYCFGDPNKSKLVLNSYVAHPPQNLNARFLWAALTRVFYEVWLPNQGNFKFHAQVHDCLLFSYRIGFDHLAWQVKAIMEEIAMPVTDPYGTTRILKVPADLKGGATRWSDLKKLKKKSTAL